nr:HipA family kinase [Providencia rettgeri]
MQNNNHLEVTEAIRQMDAGSTEPVLCSCDDGNLYVVKSNASVSRRELIHEYVASVLAKKINLPIPDFAIVHIPSDIIDFLPPHLRGKLACGYAFASQYIEDSASISFTLAHQLIDIQKQKEIYLFDRLINNSDRSLTQLGGNVNIIYNVKKQSYYLIDHNLAFASDCDIEMFEYHVFSPRNRDWQYDMFDAISNEELIERINSSCNDALAEIPYEWIDDNSSQKSIVDNILHTVARGKDGAFRSTIIWKYHYFTAS